jgi:hypothetical protein
MGKGLARGKYIWMIQGMRTAIFADTHGNRAVLHGAVKAHLPLERIIHLGDGTADAEDISSEFTIPLTAVAGNEDGASTRPERLVINLYDVPALALHGHRQDLNPYYSEAVWEEIYRDLASLGLLAGARMVLFGHTHRPVLLERSGATLVNPGSLYPGSPEHSFALAENNSGRLRLSLVRSTDGKSWEEYQNLRQQSTLP